MTQSLHIFVCAKRVWFDGKWIVGPETDAGSGPSKLKKKPESAADFSAEQMTDALLIVDA